MADIHSAHEQSDLYELSAEICVIGSGPGGAIPAVTLAELGHQVLVLEAGPAMNGGGITQLVRQVHTQSEVDLPPIGTVQLGGSSNLWAGRVVSLDPIDFEHREWVDYSGWPISRSDLPYDQASALLIGHGGRAPNDSTKPHGIDKPLAMEDVEAKEFRWAPQPFNARRYLQDAARRLGAHLRILVDAPVFALHERNDGGGIDSAIVRRRDGRECKVTAKIFILAAGGIETPRILLSPTNASTAGIGNGHDLVGRFLSTHPKADIATLTLSRRVATNHPLFSDTAISSGQRRFGLGFNSDKQRRASLLNHCVQLSPVLEYRTSQLFETIKRSKAIKSPFIDTRRIAPGLLPTLGLFAFESIGRVGRWQPRAKVFVVRGFLDQYPNPENRVRLSRTHNDLGIPTSEVSWTFTQSDRRSVIAFLGELDTALKRQGIGSIDFKPLVSREGEWPLTGLHSHFMGTTKMGANPHSGVVDLNCRVFGQSNLYVSGPSVFATYGYANPFLTIAALGLRLAQHVHRRVSRPSVAS